jgi:hypothetical protein
VIHIVPFEPGSDPSQDFASERSEKTEKTGKPTTTPGAAASLVAHKPHDEVRTLPPPADAKPADASSIAVTVPRVKWRVVALALLGVAVLVQAGFIAYWVATGRVAVGQPDAGSVTFTSEPSGSPVIIDGAAHGVTPLTITLASGNHIVDIGSGSQVRRRELNVSRGGTSSMHVELAATAAETAKVVLGGLQIVTEPPGARVSIDGEPRGVAPMTVPDLAVGEHTVTVRGNSGEPINRTVSISAGAVSSLVISMNAPPTFTSGTLTINSGVPLQILENGSLVGTTEMSRVLLPAGTHELELVNPGLNYRLNRRVVIAAGQTTTVTLPTPNGTVSINALPWAEVWINGQRSGETPIGNLAIAIGTHEVIFRHPQFGEQRRTVTVGAGAPVRVGVDMRTK